ncbi:MAG: TlyA family RNA methyltransferase [Actinomycetospora chiangmaiensis]|nr:TlyA family RNA methyltransferase [Actinomycetospora chiangmaiensis]
MDDEAAVFAERLRSPEAQEAIAAGLVTVDGAVVAKAAARVDPGARLAAEPVYPWVSRGGVKLAAALDAFGIRSDGRIALDAGASTGGFTDVLLARGAAHVYAVDVGRDQLHPRLRADPRIVDWSGTDARSLHPGLFPEPPSLVVCDASFISLTLLLPALLPLAGRPADFVGLVKPQFEAGRAHVRKGVVRDRAAQEAACTRVRDAITTHGWRVAGLIPSPILGQDGNAEFLIWAQA